MKLGGSKTVKLFEPNPERGKRGDFSKITITMPLDMIEALEAIRMKKKRAKERNADMSSLIREAVANWLSRTEG